MGCGGGGSRSGGRGKVRVSGRGGGRGRWGGLRTAIPSVFFLTGGSKVDRLLGEWFPVRNFNRYCNNYSLTICNRKSNILCHVVAY